MLVVKWEIVIKSIFIRKHYCIYRQLLTKYIVHSEKDSKFSLSFYPYMQIHRSCQSFQAPPSLDVMGDSQSSNLPIKPYGKKKTQLHLPLTAVLEPSNSFLQSISDEVPMNGNSLCSFNAAKLL